MADDIVERLKNMWMEQEPKLLWTDMESITEKAAEEITRLRAENEKLREALKPFATAGRHFKDDGRKTLVVTIGVDIGDLQAAAAAIRESGDE